MAAAEPPDEQRLTPKGRATRERIVEAAAELILTDGFSAFNMDKVRRAASVSGSQLAHYFADKQALIRAVLGRQINVVLDFHRNPQLHGLESFDDFERWIDLNMRYLRRIGYQGTPTFHALVGRLAKSDDATRETLAEAYWKWVTLLEQAMRRMKDRGVLVADAKDGLGAALVEAASGAGRDRLLQLDPSVGGRLGFLFFFRWNFFRGSAQAPDGRQTHLGQDLFATAHFSGSVSTSASSRPLFAG